MVVENSPTKTEQVVLDQRGGIEEKLREIENQIRKLIGAREETQQALWELQQTCPHSRRTPETLDTARPNSRPYATCLLCGVLMIGGKPIH